MDETYRLVKEKDFRVVNIDATISAQRPRLKDYIPGMESSIASVLDIEPEMVNIKATTTEQLGFEGREEGISVQAVVLIRKI